MNNISLLIRFNVDLAAGLDIVMSLDFAAELDGEVSLYVAGGLHVIASSDIAAGLEFTASFNLENATGFAIYLIMWLFVYTYFRFLKF